jgi:hypothetical protein
MKASASPLPPWSPITIESGPLTVTTSNQSTGTVNAIPRTYSTFAPASRGNR